MSRPQVRISNSSGNIIRTVDSPHSTEQLAMLPAHAMCVYVVRCARRVYGVCQTEFHGSQQTVGRLIAALESALLARNGEIDPFCTSPGDRSYLYDMADKARRFVEMSRKGVDAAAAALAAETCTRFGSFVLTATWGELLNEDYVRACDADYQTLLACANEHHGRQTVPTTHDMGPDWPGGTPDLARSAFYESQRRSNFFARCRGIPKRQSGASKCETCQA